LLTIINNTVTTERKSAAEVHGSNHGSLGSARVGGVGVTCAVIALLLGSIPSSVTAFPSTGGRAAIIVVSVVVITFLLGVKNTITQGGEFAVGSAGGSGHVTIASSEVTLLSCVLDTISAGRSLAGGSAGVGKGIVVIGSPVALFSSGSINIGVSAEEGASHTAKSLSVVFFPFVAFLSQELINNSITAGDFHAVASAQGTTVAFLSMIGINHSVTADQLTVGITWRGDVSVVDSVIAILTESKVGKAITARWENTSLTASRQENSVRFSIITDLTQVENSVTTSSVLTVGSAGTGEGVAIFWSIVALLVAIQESVAAEEGTPGVAGGSTDLAGVALFVGIDVTVTAGGKGTSGLARVGSVLVGFSVIALLTSVDDTVTASEVHSVSSAGSRAGVGAEWSVVALLTGLNDSVVEGTVGEFGDVEVKLGKEGVGGGSNVVEEGNTDPVSVRSGVEELSLEVGVESVDGVLRGGVELDPHQVGTSEGVGSGGEEGEGSSGVDELDLGGFVGEGGKGETGVQSLDLGGVDVDGGLTGIGSLTSTGGVEGR